jgi:NAD+ diphosphatase
MSATDPQVPPAAFSGMELDRAAVERKDPAVVAELLGDPSSRAVLAGRDGVVIGDGSLLRAELERDAEYEPILLGLEDGEAVFAIDVDSLTEAQRVALTGGAGVVGLRDVIGRLSRPEAGLAAYLAALLNWHRRHRFCSNCGAATEIIEAGYSRRCPRCGTLHFPRTDPVVIMTVGHDGRLLLGRRGDWPPGRLSVLAGFVSPGESAQEAVVREVFEESGIVARDPAFVTSQPWPFPSSLMLGFHAEADGGEPRVSDGELQEVGWFPRDEVIAALRGEHPDLALPPPYAIARLLIDRWVESTE